MDEISIAILKKIRPSKSGLISDNCDVPLHHLPCKEMGKKRGSVCWAVRMEVVLDIHVVQWYKERFWQHCSNCHKYFGSSRQLGRDRSNSEIVSDSGFVFLL